MKVESSATQQRSDANMRFERAAPWKSTTPAARENMRIVSCVPRRSLIVWRPRVIGARGRGLGMGEGGNAAHLHRLVAMIHMDLLPRPLPENLAHGRRLH
eukprot:1154867-Prymnesium_polylepis.1